MDESWRMAVAESLPCWLDADGRICDLVLCDNPKCHPDGLWVWVEDKWSSGKQAPCPRCRADDGTPPGWVAVPRGQTT